jgi:hypothetical protein
MLLCSIARIFEIYGADLQYAALHYFEFKPFTDLRHPVPHTEGPILVGYVITKNTDRWCNGTAFCKVTC